MPPRKKATGPEPYTKAPPPNYPVVPLRSETIRVAAVQMRPKNIDPEDPKPGIKERLNSMLHLIDLMQTKQHVDLLCYPEFSLQGSAIRLWSRDDYLRLAIELPGEETEAIGKKARQYNCYIELASYTKEADWPGHFMNTSFIVGPKGDIIHKHWKAHFDPGLFEYSTSVHDVLDEFVERYGWDAVWPVARTDIGNIATFICSEGFQPETARVFAFKGAEVLVRSFSGASMLNAVRWGDARLTMRAYCMNSDVYGILANNAVGETNEYAYEDGGGGYSMIIDNVGRVLYQAQSVHETMVVDCIPIAAFRKTHTTPVLRTELYAREYAEYKGKYPANLYRDYLPKDHNDAVDYFRRKARW